MKALELLDSGVEALRNADWEALTGLAERAGEAEIPHCAGEVAALRSRRRTAALLLTLTARNIRLLRGECDSRSSYGRLES